MELMGTPGGDRDSIPYTILCKIMNTESYSYYCNLFYFIANKTAALLCTIKNVQIKKTSAKQHNLH